jgi:UDP-N-acetylmuramate dehydrogenase
MNAGGHGSDIAAVLSRCELFDLATGRTEERRADELGLGYRHSAVGAGEVVIWADFLVTPGDRAESEAEIAGIVRWRRQHQPGGSNAGSVFTNPDGDSAGRLVEAAGLKGWRMGTARVSERHANFIQADEDGSADDVRRLIDHVRTAVAGRFGIELGLEVRLVGFADVPAETVRAPAPVADAGSWSGSAYR